MNIVHNFYFGIFAFAPLAAQNRYHFGKKPIFFWSVLVLANGRAKATTMQKLRCIVLSHFLRKKFCKSRIMKNAIATIVFLGYNIIENMCKRTIFVLNIKFGNEVADSSDVH